MVSVGEVNAPQNINSGTGIGDGAPVGSFGWFAVQILQGIGAPVNPKTYAFMVAWMQKEHGGGGGRNNPLNTTERWPGSTSYNSIGVQNFATPQDGVQALTRNLTGGHYSQIVAGLQTGDPAATFGATDEWHTFVGPGTPGADYVNSIVSIYNHNLGNPAGMGMQSAGSGPTSGSSAGMSSARGIPGYLMSQYGYLLNDPEIGPLLQAFANDPNADVGEFQAKIQNTNFWKSHSATSRNWLQQQYADPATFQQQFAAAEAQTEQMAANYGIAVTSSAAKAYAHNLTMNYDPKAIQQNFVTQTKALYPHLSPQLDQGLTLRDIAQPYLTQASNLLEKPADSFSLTDPKFTAPLAMHDGKQVRQMTSAEWASQLMSNPAFGWDKTANARDSAVNLTAQLAQTFGASS